jgi:hypothetical protein
MLLRLLFRELSDELPKGFVADVGGVAPAYAGESNNRHRGLTVADVRNASSLRLDKPVEHREAVRVARPACVEDGLTAVERSR